MKKTGLTVLAAVLALLLTGCGAAAPSSSAGPGNGPSGGDVSAPQASASPAVTLPETVLYDADGVRVTATGLREDSLFGPEITLMLENDSDTAVTVQSGYCAVNGWMIGSTLSQELAPGKKAEAAMTLSAADLDNARIGTISQIECTLRIVDSESFLTLAESGWVTLSTGASAGEAYEPAGTELYAENGLRILALGPQDSALGRSVLLYVENNSSADYLFTAESTSADGFMVDGHLYAEVPAGRRAITGLTLLASGEEQDRLAQMRSLEFSIRYTDPNDFLEQAVVGPFTLTFEG